MTYRGNWANWQEPVPEPVTEPETVANPEASEPVPDSVVDVIDNQNETTGSVVNAILSGAASFFGYSEAGEVDGVNPVDGSGMIAGEAPSTAGDMGPVLQSDLGNPYIPEQSGAGQAASSNGVVGVADDFESEVLNTLGGIITAFTDTPTNSQIKTGMTNEGNEKSNTKNDNTLLFAFIGVVGVAIFFL